MIATPTGSAGKATRPSATDPEFLLRSGELLELARGELRVVAYEHGRIEHPRPANKHRPCAIWSEATAPLCPEP